VGQVCLANGEGVCKPLRVDAGTCWEGSDCGANCLCYQASVCGCGMLCLIEDQPGTCVCAG